MLGSDYKVIKDTIDKNGSILKFYALAALMVVIAFIAYLLLRVYRLTSFLKVSNYQLTHQNQTLNEKVEIATKDIQLKMEELYIQKEKAECATVAKSEFLANMSHEIRTPLNGIYGMGQVLRKSSLDKKQQGFVDVILNSIDNLSSIINDILDFSKIEAGKIDIEQVSFDILSLVESAIDQVTPVANEARNQLLIRCHPDVPKMIVGDPIRVNQVLLNLLSNANKFTGGGFVHIAIEMGDIDGVSMVFVSVKDSGVGISKDKQALIFSAFSQENSSTTREYGGTGLGLTISRRLSQLMGGDIAMESKLGSGSTFTFYFPLLYEGKNSVNKAVKSPQARIYPLIFDRDDVRRKALQIQLESWGLDYHSCQTVAELEQWVEGKQNGTRHCTCLIVAMDEEGEILQAINKASATMSVLALAPLYDSGSSDSELADEFSGAIISPIKPSELMDTLVGAHSENLTAKTPLPESDLPDFQGKTILLVDDSEINRTVVEFLMEAVNVNLRSAENGRMAVDIVMAETIDLVLMDCQMPVMDGFEATKQIRILPEKNKQRVAIIAMTANAMSGDKEQCLAAGMDDYIAKPVDADDLYQMMSQWLKVGFTGNKKNAL
ncbi:ATP-binding protein [Oceanicoccus sagamiensis]|uniref:Sensory/regulatory protein RpfC n=1 Tax=Oceanicoccus sagamiensis TaxID=716816 RepID=A0A1X9N7E9_9GAMM|nr:ATP-binding protein [Oceanicoccus sagamiensis]ARN73121.1 hypothetical protein BST96_02765 [Oceanicoccus sagamiensis]